MRVMEFLAVRLVYYLRNCKLYLVQAFASETGLTILKFAHIYFIRSVQVLLNYSLPTLVLVSHDHYNQT